MNTEESQKIHNAAMSYFKAGDFVKALKLFKASNAANQSDVTESYIRRCEHAIKESQKESTPSSSSTKESSSASRSSNEERGNGATASRQEQQQASSSSSGDGQSFTQEQVDDCKKILRIKDFYEILGVQKTADDNEIKKAYRKLALKFHPDKNHAPQAKEAFMKVGQAYDCLTNKDKRSFYDQTGNSDPDQHYRQYTQQYHYEEFSPDDLFEMIFGIPSGHRRRPARQQNYYYSNEEDVGARHHNTHQGRGVPRGKYAMLLQLLPLIFVLLSSFLYSFNGEEEAVYSLSPHGKYNMQHSTRRLNINYFVMQDFKTKHVKSDRDLLRVENDVEEQYMIYHYRKCEQGKANRDRIMMQARWYYGAERERLAEVARNIDLSACDEFRRVHSVIDPRGHRWF